MSVFGYFLPPIGFGVRRDVRLLQTLLGIFLGKGATAIRGVRLDLAAMPAGIAIYSFRAFHVCRPPSGSTKRCFGLRHVPKWWQL